VVSGVLALTVLLASLIPARKAASTDAAIALRDE
jgi:ABC-type lipoprotein release transport system permease subunit